MRKRLYWIWLSLCCTPGSDTFAKLLGKFSTPEEIYQQDSNSLASVISSKNADYNALLDKDTSRAEEILEFCSSKGVGILTYDDEKFPKSLKSISTPPVLLYYRGVLPDFSKNFCISIVGTRSLSDYGRKNAFSVARDLAMTGATIVSGMAIGIDGVALAGALSADCPTIAVIGSGIDVCYPSQHQFLAREIVKSGCVFTEYPPGTPPSGKNFPIRNRIISGLSVATLVIEGRERSGAIITARCAKEQGKRVFALPGNVGNSNSEASNLLIRNGAGLFTAATDIILALEKDFVGKLNPCKLSYDKVDMFHYLTEYRVSCVAPSDSIFCPPRSKPKPISADKAGKKEENITIPKDSIPESTVETAPSVDAKTLALYKKIPISGEILVNSLIDETHSLKDVMQGLLKLEMLKFVTMLPGDRVSRKLK